MKKRIMNYLFAAVFVLSITFFGAAIVNAAEDVSVSIPVRRVVSGGSLLDGCAVTISEGGKVVDSLKVSGDLGMNEGEFHLTYTQPGTHSYKIARTPGVFADAVYDDSEYELTVYCFVDDDGGLYNEVVLKKDGAGGKVNAVEFRDIIDIIHEPTDEETSEEMSTEVVTDEETEIEKTTEGRTTEVNHTEKEPAGQGSGPDRTSKAVKTGDSSSLMRYAAVFILSLVSIASALAVSKRRKEDG